MAAWDTISTDFGSDETAVFGQRQESGSALYQVETIATISSKDAEENVVPKIVSSILGELACVAVEHHLSVFRDLHYIETIAFESAIDCVEWSPDERLLLIGDNQGMLFMYETDSFEAVLSFMVIPETDRRDGKAFKKIMFQTREDELHNLYCLAESGHLYVIRNLNLSLFSKDTENLKGQLMKDLQFVNIETSDSHTGQTNDVIVTKDSVYTLGSGESILTLWNWSDNQLVIRDEVEDILANNAGLEEGKVSTDGKHLMLRDSNNTVTLWCARTLTMLQVYSQVKVAHFELLDTCDSNNNNSVCGIKLVLMSVPKEEKCSLLLQELPAFSSIYSLQLEAETTLSACIPTQEVLYVVEVMPSEQPGSSATVRFRCLMETNPEIRLYRMLQKKKLEEAEAFARLYKLDLELVYKVKLGHLLDQLSPWNHHKHQEEELTELTKRLWDCLHNIKDNADIVEKCVRAALPTLEETWKLIMFCKERLKSSSSPDTSLMSKVLHTEHRLITYRYIHESEGYRAERWDQFSKADLLKECLSALRNGSITTAFTLWTRHQVEWGTRLDANKLDHFLKEIPDQMTAADVQGWLQMSLIPHIGMFLPNALENIVSWVIQKALSMELLEKEHWPQNALNFLREIHASVSEVVEIPSQDGKSPIDCGRKSITKSESVLEPLREMMTSLRELAKLHSKYNCPLKLTNFLQETTESVTFRMLDRVVALELIIPTLNREIRPYMQEHKLNEDQVFSRYIKDLLRRTSNIKSYTGESIWETKAVAIIGFIKDPREKAEAILEVMTCVSIPLSEGVEGLIQTGLKIDHPFVKKLREELRTIEVKKLMAKYGLKNIRLPTEGNLQQMMRHIIVRDFPSCISDALQLIQAYKLNLEPELYFSRLHWLISKNRVDDYFDLLKTLPVDLCLEVGRRIIILAQVTLNSCVYHTESMRQNQRLFTEAAVGTARWLVQDIQEHVKSEVYEDLRRDYREMMDLLALQEEYQKFPTLTEYRCQESRETILVEYLKEFFTSQHNGKRAVSFPKVYRLAHLLKIPRVKLHGQLAIKASETGSIETALEHCSKLMESEPTWATGDVLYNVALSFMKLCETNKSMEEEAATRLRDLSFAASELAGSALTVCSPDRLAPCLNLFKSLSLCQAVSRQCESGEYSLCVQNDESMLIAKELEDTWNLTPMFKEEALVMNSTTVLPLTVTYLVSQPGFKNSTMSDAIPHLNKTVVSDMSVPLGPLIKHLKENSHLELAHQFISHVTSVVTQYVTQFDMGLTKNQPKESLMKIKDHWNKHLNDYAPILHALVDDILQKIFNAGSVDHNLALSYMLSLPHKIALNFFMKLVSSSGHNYKKLRALAKVGHALGILLRETKVTGMCESLEKGATWGHRLAKIKIDFKMAFQGHKKDKLKIIKTIAQNDAADVNIIKDYCSDFDLDVTKGLLVYIQHVLTVDMPLWEGAGKLPQLHSRSRKARCAIRAMEKTDKLEEELNKLLKQCNPYNYEIIRFLLEELQVFDEPLSKKGLELLGYISVYTRRYPPSEYEQQYRSEGDREELTGSLGTLPIASQTRIPFHPLMFGDPWKIVTPELEDESVDIWLPIARLLKLSEDQMPLMAVQNMVKRYVKFMSHDKTRQVDKANCDWSFSEDGVLFLDKVENLLLNVSSCEMGMACATWLFRELPMGGEKLLALKRCMAFAEKWYHACDDSQKSQKDKAQKAFLKFSSVYKRQSTERVLFRNDLAEPDLLALCNQPEDLVVKLYEHPSVTASWDCDVKHPDIHAVVAQIAEANDLNLCNVCFGLIRKWLPSGNAKQDADATMTFNFENLKFSEEEPQQNDEDCLTRAIYVMKKLPEDIVVFVHNLVMEQDDPEITSQSRVNGLFCLLKAIDSELLHTYTLKTVTELNELMRTLSYLVELEKLHIQHSVRTFTECNKEGLIMGIWRNHSHQKTGVLLVASLCRDYKIYDCQLWNNVLKQMMSQNMLSELEQVVLHLCGVPDAWAVPAFVTAWQTVLSTPLNKVCAPLGDEQTKEVLFYFNLLSRCPVLTSLNLTSLSNQYQSLELSVCGIGCLLMSPALNQKLAEDIVEDPTKCLDEVKHFTSLGLNTYAAQQIKDFVYRCTDNKMEYSSVDKHHLPEFVKYLISHHCIDGMLQFAIESDRLDEAGRLVSMYMATHNDVDYEVQEYMSEHGEDDVLQAYLKMRNITV